MCQCDGRLDHLKQFTTNQSTDGMNTKQYFSDNWIRCNGIDFPEGNRINILLRMKDCVLDRNTISDLIK